MNMNDNLALPLVSVGIPTYNRPEGLRRTLECITNQTYANLEIIVSDNCSPDPQVVNVVNEFKQVDSRIRFYRQDENIGAQHNFKFVLGQSTGKYFMWAADDDKWNDFYIAELVNCLETLGPQYVAANFEAQYFDRNGNLFEFFEEGKPFYDFFDTNAFNRITHMLKFNYGNIIYSLYNRDVLQNGNLIYADNEIPFLLQIIQRGNWCVLPKVGFYKQTVSDTYQQAKWEKTGGKLPTGGYIRLKPVNALFNNIKSSFGYHIIALRNIKKAVKTLGLNPQQYIRVHIMLDFFIWQHLGQLIVGYKRRPF
jgi:glycosyltransferase involved in cell wall biosynthesis